MNKQKLVGKKVTIKSNVDSSFAGWWGNIVSYDEDGTYFISMAGDETNSVVFERYEFTIARNQ